MQQSKRIVSLLLALIMVISLIMSSGAMMSSAATAPYTDVSAEDWFYENVKSLKKMKLMIGYQDGTFRPEEDISLAESITVAARIHTDHYNNGKLRQKGLWYSVYADYALKNGLLDKAPADYEAAATRLEFAHLLAKSLPTEGLKAINRVPDGAIPDVKGDEAIYLLYRAGVLIGADDEGNFYPERPIQRSEVAAIITRMADPSLRLKNGIFASADVEVDTNGNVKTDVSIDATDAKANVAAGTAAESGAEQLALSVSKMETTGGNIQLGDSEELSSYDVHIDGLAEDNTVPVLVELNTVLPVGLNLGNITVYHIEDGATNTMAQVTTLAELDAHNEFYYDPATGKLTVAMASFSEVAFVVDTVNPWNGEFDYSWYTGEVALADTDATTEYTIANADQLAAFGAIVGGMNEVTGRNEGSYTYSEDVIQDSFKGKTIKLISDINLDDGEGDGKIFYPIGYNSNDGKYEKTGEAITSSLKNFEGTFDGNGHTISNFYHNTWEMKGDNNYYGAELQYYRDGMGLFGRVYGGTVKNLTVKNFSSDGEYTTTGVIAAYADHGATFENIAIFNCNPRVYNIGNGGIVGCVGWYNKAETDKKVTFKNITVDNSNKISALWGSYDVACGGIVGQYYPTSGQSSANYPVNAGIEFVNCHVSAQMDVYNDVCANYQYYAYRYTGMLIGSVRENETIDGHTYPKMNGITASGCTVHFGTWNDYYYCEIIDNTTASYTHDYQMSRLTEIKAIDGTTITYLDGTTGTVPASGRANYVVVNGKHATENATCYHFKNGEVWNHSDAGTEIVDGVEVLVEDKQHLYLEFNNLVTGYGWGVTSKGLTDFEGVENMDITLGNEESVVKFAKADAVKDSYTTGTTVTIGNLFAATDAGLAEKTKIKDANVQVAVTPVGDDSNANGTYVANTTDWTQGTLTFSGTGKATITIQDYYFCTPTTIEVTVKDRQPEVKFDVVMNNGDFLHRVGNSGTVALDKLFKAKDGVTVGAIDVTIEAVNGTTASGTYANNAIQFSGTGVVKVTITDNDYCTPTVLYLEVVDATNVTGLSGTISGNVVLLNDCGLSSLTVSGRNAVYGNGFTATYTGNGQYLNNGLKQGVVTVSENGTLDNLRIVAPIYPKAYLYYGSTLLGDYVQGGPSSVEGDKTRYHYQLSAVAASGNATIDNCYIYGGRNNIFVNTGDVTVKDTVLECGTVANVQIQSNTSHTITFENVTTIQYQVNPTVWGAKTETEDKEKVMLGAGVLLGPETESDPKIVLNGYFKQYNWVTKEDADAVSDTKVTKAIIEGAVNATEYNHTVNGKSASNLGIIYMNEYGATVTNNTKLPYQLGTVSMTMAGNTVNGQVYSLKGASAEQIYSDYENADRNTVNGLYRPQFKYDDDLGEQYIAEGGDEHCYREDNTDTVHVMFPSGDTKELNLAALVEIVKYTGQDLGLTVACKDENGNDVTVTGGKVSLSTAGEYTVTYTVADTLFYKKDGSTVTNSIEYSWNVTVSVSLKDTAVPNARFDFNKDSQKMGYYKPTIGDVKQYLPFLAGLKIYDYNGKTEYLRFDGDNDFNKVASITVTNKYSGNDALVEVKLTDGGVILAQFLARADSGGGSTYTGKIKTKDNVVYFVNDGGTSNKDTTTTAAYWYVDYYKFTGNNGVAIQSTQQTFTSTGKSASTPSGNFSTTIKYTVTYEANEGTCGQAVGYATSVSAAVTLPTPTRSGYIFAGWYTAASGGTRVGGAGESYTPSANITLYAQWGKPCTVTYNANGGSCGTASDKYTGTALTLPTPIRDGYWFIGWYDAATGGNKIGDAGAKYNPAGEITLYAHWQEKVEYTVTYNANGGSCGTASATYQGTPLTLPTPTRTGYTFNGWYTAVEGGNKIGDAGASYTPSANVTLYAQWEQIAYKITVSTSNATVSSVTNGQTAHYGDTISITVSFTQSNNKTLTVKDANGNTILSKSTAGTYTFTMPDSNVTISASSEKSCVTADTLITLADGTQKRIDEVTYEDQLLVWDFFKGEYTTVPSAIIFYHGDEEYDVLALGFEDGTIVKTINGHGFFDVEENQFVFIDEENVADYVGHHFVKVDGDGRTEVELVGYEAIKEYTGCYSIQSAVHINFVTEGMFSMTVPPFDGWFEYFEIGDDMKYDAAKLQADIEKYGLYTYEDFAEYVTYEQFIAFNGPYLKVLVGRGVVTYEGILELIASYVSK